MNTRNKICVEKYTGEARACAYKMLVSLLFLIFAVKFVKEEAFGATFARDSNSNGNLCYFVDVFVDL